MLTPAFRTVALIDTVAFLHNLQEIRAHMPADCLLMGVIKANAYGHGAVHLARKAGNLYDAYATATIPEALELRQAQLTKPILILGHIFPCDYAAAVTHNITITLSSLAMAHELQIYAQTNNVIAEVHLAVDSGMGRIGFAPDPISLVDIAMIAKLPNLRITGMFTHYATADEADLTFALQQQQVFQAFAQAVRDQGVALPLLHTANSAALTQLEGAAVGMVRAGIVQYGLQPSSAVDVLDLHPVLSWQACITHVKTVPAGTPIGYGCTWTAPTARTIATVPVGYADGYPRALSNCGQVLVQGQYAPIVGRVCMDQFMVDVTDILGVQVGTVVTLLGADGENTITADDIANLTNTISYEVLCNISARVERYYI